MMNGNPYQEVFVHSQKTRFGNTDFEFELINGEFMPEEQQKDNMITTHQPCSLLGWIY